MALVIDLKPNERVIIGGALITNDNARTRLHIEGDTPILREKDIMRECEANTPCKRIYMTIQLMYISLKPETLHVLYFEQVREVQTAAPSMAIKIMEINDFILNDQYYKALKETQKLIEYEESLLNNG